MGAAPAIASSANSVAATTALNLEPATPAEKRSRCFTVRFSYGQFLWVSYGLGLLWAGSPMGWVSCGRVLLSLGWLWRRWIVATRGTGKYAPAIRKLDQTGVARLRAVLRQHAIDGDLVARLQGVAAPAVPRQRIRRTALALPVLQAPLSVLHIQINPDVGIRPLELRHGARQRHGLARIELGREGVMRGKRLSQGDHQAGANHEMFRLHM